VIKQLPGYPIDLFVGTLGREDSGNQKLKGRFVNQRSFDFWITPPQYPTDFIGSVPEIHEICQLIVVGC